MMEPQRLMEMMTMMQAQANERLRRLLLRNPKRMTIVRVYALLGFTHDRLM
jgi:hypothetical protein